MIARTLRQAVELPAGARVVPQALLALAATYAVLVSSACGVTPAAEVRVAVLDLAERVPAVERPGTRYVSLYAIAPQKRREAAAVVSFLLNSVARADTIALPVQVAGSQGRLLRFSLDRLKIDRRAWEALAGEDPYFRLRTQVIDPQTGEPRSVITDGGWVGLAQAAELRAMSESAGALVRADYFIARAATTADGGHYYSLAGIPPREQDFFALLGIDAVATGKLHADQGANLIRSRVTFKMRRVVRRQGPLGAAWHTYDVERSTPERDPIRNPFGFTYDAGEHIATKRNGLHLFALYDNKGRRQDSVPDKIAKDTADPHGAGVIVSLLSCVRCHSESGLRPVSNDQRRLLAGRVDLLTERAEDAERLASFYDRDLNKHLARDREDYAAAVATATGGLTVERLAAAFGDQFAAYVDALVTPAQAARELGVAEADLAHSLSGADDPVILALCTGLAVQRQQWEAAFAQAALCTTKGTNP